MYDNLVLVTRTRVVRWLPDMRSVCVTVTEGARVVVSGRAIRVDDSATLSSVVALVVGDPLVHGFPCGSRPGIEHNLRHQIRRNIRRRGWTAAGIRETLLFFPLAHGDDVTAGGETPAESVPVIMPPGRRISLKSTSQYCPYARPVRL